MSKINKDIGNLQDLIKIKSFYFYEVLKNENTPNLVEIK